jgi:hypothetical protein
LAALDAVNRMGDLALPIRIGICSGPVILRKTGRDDEDYDVAGITAHIAARLEQQAEPGTVLLAQQTASLVTGIANIESIGRIALKGIAEPLPVFRLISATDRPSWIVRSGAEACRPLSARRRTAQLSCLGGRGRATRRRVRGWWQMPHGKNRACCMGSSKPGARRMAHRAWKPLRNLAIPTF